MDLTSLKNEMTKNIKNDVFKNMSINNNKVKYEPFGKPPPGYIPGKGRGVTGFSGGVSRDDTTDDKDKNDYSDFNYDEFHGYSESLFKDTEYDEEDKEADEIYDKIDSLMDIRRKSRRENKLKEEISKMRATKPTITQQFGDLKKNLANVTIEEWESIPTVLQYSSKQKQKKVQKNYLPAPDSLIMSRINESNIHLNFNNSASSQSGHKTPIGLGYQSSLGVQTPLGLRTPYGLQNSLSGLKTPLSGLQNSLSGLKTPLSGLQNSLSGLKTPLSGLQNSLSGLKTPLSGLQTPYMRNPSSLFGMDTPLINNNIKSNMSISGLNTPFTLSGYNTPLSASNVSGYNTPLFNNTHKLSLNDLGEARGTVLSVKLDELIDNVEGQTVIDPKGYLTNLNASSLINDADIADINKARSLLKSVISTNPKHGPGWIAAARIEELAQRKDKAKEIIMKGCVVCSKNEDIWLEAVRLEEKLSEVKIILAKAIKHIPTSVKLWLEAYKKEKNVDDKRKVLRKAIECIPNSVKLWKEAISLENENNAYILLKRAVECIPQSIEMWIALARLCTYTEAQKVLNEARKKIPTSAEIWINASQLEEKQGNIKMVDIIIKRCIENLSSKNVIFDRDKWIKFAEECEQSKFTHTCESIIRNTMHIGVETLNKKRIYKQDAQNCIHNKSIHTARTLYNEALKIFKTKKSLWLALANLELTHGKREDVDEVLHRAVQSCPHSSVLWLMLAKQKWLNNEIDKAREILAESFIHNQNTEEISLAAIKLERENNEFDRARFLLKKSRVQCNTPKIWMQSVQLERLLRNYKEAKMLAHEALKIHKHFDKLYMIAGQIELEMYKYSNDTNININITSHKTYIKNGCDDTKSDDSKDKNINTKRTTSPKHYTTTNNNDDDANNDSSCTSNNFHNKQNGDNKNINVNNKKEEFINITNDPYKNAQNIYEEGLKYCASSINLWICAIDLQIEKKNYTGARALTEKAKIKIKYLNSFNNNSHILKSKEIIETNEQNYDTQDDEYNNLNKNMDGSKSVNNTTASNISKSKNELEKKSSVNNNAYIKIIENYDLLWLKLIEIELCCNNKNLNPIISEALKECPSSGILWSKAIELENKNLQNSKSVSAFNHCGNNAYVILTVAKLFWVNFKIQKARKWFYRVINLNPHFGDGWATFLAFEIDQQNEINQKDIINKCIKAEPNRGYLWNKITKRVENWRLKYPQKLYKYIKDIYPHVLNKKISDPIWNIITDENADTSFLLTNQENDKEKKDQGNESVDDEKDYEKETNNNVEEDPEKDSKEQGKRKSKEKILNEKDTTKNKRKDISTNEDEKDRKKKKK
ncbi:pre-mRNA-processing factor 6 [Plasmodium falciparum NF54]|uniref:Pre-mRNA-processing factor 6, putative n=2 Tax=Plasmodium falciparum TaxID=5833 RepID=Q8IIR0_PLAF7|nr:pre-mRNA-processing factor 6, putative [Plasmodium falciparum 3D7]KAF4331255.1 pre-mRNA-processing factor 6 [Plasmodium falciparum NF54]PKC49211.1 pre-mRNA-processing factor 6 [Plasmodium falciparum NF54]CZT98762.1 pre-mRNA-processing factor 6, putative [Plasmodium falciparum 3D7]|eukprot:XP_001347781.1 pre-mRNA-processing factor 6, putative [Plasmodium falciparum 3D7]